MKKLSFLIALMLCLGCFFLTACSDNEQPQSTPDVSDTDDTTADTTADTTDDTSDTENETTERGPIDDGKDAYADDIYEGVTPEIYG